jgi:hypothetical protein
MARSNPGNNKGITKGAFGQQDGISVESKSVPQKVSKDIATNPLKIDLGTDDAPYSDDLKQAEQQIQQYGESTKRIEITRSTKGNRQGNSK